MIGAISLCAIVGLFSGANVMVKTWFFNAVEGLMQGDYLSKAVALGIFWGAFTLITLLLQGASDVFMEDLGLRLGGFLGREVNSKAAKIDPICYEDTEVLDHINKACQGVERAAAITCTLITLVAFYIPYFIFFSVYTFRIHPILCIGVLLVLLPTLGGQYIRSRYYGNLENTAAPIRRQMDYYQSCITEREYVKETRLLGAVYFFRTLYETVVILYRREAWKTERKSSLVELVLRLLSLLSYVVILVVMFKNLKAGNMGTAAFAAILTSIDQMFNYMDYVGYNVGDISQNLSTLTNTVNFLNLPERRGGKEEVPPNWDIVFDHVSFGYPGHTNHVINDISLSISAGETIAVVGANGAGKSTLVKLLTGLYIPNNGSVYIGGKDTKELLPDSIYEGISGVFQDFQKYKISLRENISISDSRMEESREKLEASLQEAGVDSSMFSEGMNTMLSREFGGTDISGGQWQRVAIGRGLYRKHQLIILDEPTAAIDPLEESRIYNRFAEISKNKTSIIIIHRIGSARIADRVVVMDQGQIVGVGTHTELLKNNEMYQKMFYAQSHWYQ